MKHLGILVEGMVQGVGFRWAARSQANRLGVKGFVRNEVDGSVYIEAEGEDPALELFVAWCRQGPSSARVHRVEITEGRVKGFTSYDIRM